jgi:hypothetical protein
MITHCGNILSIFERPSLFENCCKLQGQSSAPSLLGFKICTMSGDFSEELGKSISKRQKKKTRSRTCVRNEENTGTVTFFLGQSCIDYVLMSHDSVERRIRRCPVNDSHAVMRRGNCSTQIHHNGPTNGLRPPSSSITLALLSLCGYSQVFESSKSR